jgi:hypothetical protein
MSQPWAWCPPDVHIHTGRLCSVGAGRHPVPQRPRAYAALRLPAPVGPGSGAPCRGLPRYGCFFCAIGPTTRAPANVSCVEDPRTGSPSNRAMARRGAGRPGAWAVLCVRAIVAHPAGDASLLAHLTQRALWPSSHPALSAAGKARGGGAAYPWPTRSRTYAAPVPCLRPSPGALPARAGSPFAGRVSHPRDDEQSFMKVSPPPFLCDQQGLVALKFLSTAADAA